MEKDASGPLSNHRLFGQYDSRSRFGVSSVPHQTRKTAVTTCLSALILNVFAFAVSAQILINEVDADQQGKDNAEFVEIFDGGSGNTDLSGLVLVFFNGYNDTAYRAFNLDGFSTNRAGYFVLCGNSETVAHCDSDVSPDSNLIQNGADAIALYMGDKENFRRGTVPTTAHLIDAIVYDTGGPVDTGLLTLLLPNQPQIKEGNRKTATKHSNQRCPNGSGGARRTDTYDQFPPTPGAHNICTTTVNAAPTTMGNIAAVTLTVGEIHAIDVSKYFSDTGDTLTYTVTSSDPDIATVTVSGGIMTIIRK